MISVALIVVVAQAGMHKVLSQQLTPSRSLEMSPKFICKRPIGWTISHSADRRAVGVDNQGARPYDEALLNDETRLRVCSTNVPRTDRSWSWSISADTSRTMPHTAQSRHRK